MAHPIDEAAPPAVSRVGAVPLYRQIADHLRHGIRTGRWSPGSQLPPESELTGMFQASRLTVRKAMEQMEREGLVSRQPGRGTFVLERAITGGPRFFGSFTDELAHLNIAAGSHVIRQQLEPAGEEVGRRLGLAQGEDVVLVERIRTGDGVPIGHQRAWLPARLFPGLESVPLEGRSLYKVLQQEYGVALSVGEEVFTIDHVPEGIASHLQIPPQTCVFRLEKVTYADNTPVELMHALLRADRYRIQLRVTGG